MAVTSGSVAPSFIATARRIARDAISTSSSSGPRARPRSTSPPGAAPEVICRAEYLPFAQGSFDVVVSRVAPHHFEDVAKGVGEMARVSRHLVLVADNLYLGEPVEEAERLRDPTHVRCCSE